MKGELVNALCSCVRNRRRNLTRRFLQGLSTDELHYIADFLGSRIIEGDHQVACGRPPVARDIYRFEFCRHVAAGDRVGIGCPSAALRDRDHKMILLVEYFERCGLEPPLDQAAKERIPIEERS